MTVPQHEPQHLNAMEAEIERTLREGIARQQPRPVAAASRPPASTAGPRPPEKWGPSAPHALAPQSVSVDPNMGDPYGLPPASIEPPRRAVTTPLQLLSQVADNTARLHEALEALVTKITGEQTPPKRMRQPPRKGSGLLPAIAHLAHDIDAAHAELARLINHVARQL